MKRMIFGGCLFIGGCILYGIAAFGVADTMVQGLMLNTPSYIGMASMLAGVVLAVIEIRKNGW